MPCDNLAVQRARLDVRTYDELRGSLPGREALRGYIQELAGLGEIQDLSYESGPLYFYGGGLAVSLNAFGDLTVQHVDRSVVDRLTPLLTTFCDELAGLLAVESLVAAVHATAFVKSDAMNHEGVRVIRATLTT